jgi:hypothetical protein
VEAVEVFVVVEVFETDLDVTFVVVVALVVVDFVCVAVVAAGGAEGAGSRVRVFVDGVCLTGATGIDVPFGGKPRSLATGCELTHSAGAAP